MFSALWGLKQPQQAWKPALALLSLLRAPQPLGPALTMQSRAPGTLHGEGKAMKLRSGGRGA